MTPQQIARTMTQHMARNMHSLPDMTQVVRNLTGQQTSSAVVSSSSDQLKHPTQLHHQQPVSYQIHQTAQQPIVSQQVLQQMTSGGGHIQSIQQQQQQQQQHQQQQQNHVQQQQQAQQQQQQAQQNNQTHQQQERPELTTLQPARASDLITLQPANALSAHQQQQQAQQQQAQQQQQQHQQAQGQTATAVQHAVKLELENSHGGNSYTRFDPVACGLDSSFRLSNFAEPRQESKLGQEALGALMLNLDMQNLSTSYMHLGVPRIGSGMEVTISPTRNPDSVLVQSLARNVGTMDDPYVMGKVACTAVLSHLYKYGIVEVDTLSLMLNISNKMTEKEQEVIINYITKGFKDQAYLAGVNVNGCQATLNPWMTCGGLAATVCYNEEILVPDNAVAGDVLVLTKPLGSSVATSVYQWMEIPDRWNRIKYYLNEADVRKAFARANDLMVRLNKTAAKLMMKYGAHACTDLSEVGILKAAQELAAVQKNDVAFAIHNLPVIAKLPLIAKNLAAEFPISQGTCPEQSGGLLIALPREKAATFCREIEKQEHYPAWIIGIVEKGQRTAKVIDKPRLIEVPQKDNPDALW